MRGIKPSRDIQNKTNLSTKEKLRDYFERSCVDCRLNRYWTVTDYILQLFLAIFKLLTVGLTIILLVTDFKDLSDLLLYLLLPENEFEAGTLYLISQLL